jgi:AcrR family transcriptional regulator
VGSKSPLRRSPVQARAKERIERVLDAAEEVFVDVGYEAATTNQIAAQAGTSIGSIYEFFGNKQAVARALADRYLTELTALYDEVVVDDPRGRDAIVAKVVDALDGFYTKHPGLGPLLRGCRGSEDLQAAGQSLQARLVDHVDRLIAVRRVGADPARRHVVAEMCADVLRCVLDEVADKPEEERKALVAELKLVLISYLTVALPRS